MKIIFIFSCSGMFRNVPACSGMFHVTGFIDALKKIITFLVRELRWTFTHIIIIFSRTEGKYLPQDKGQVKEIPVRALKTKVMSWITTFTFDIIMRCHMWTEFSVAFEYVRENWPQERLFKCKKRFAYNLTERKRYIKQESHIGSHIWFSAAHHVGS